MRLQVGKGLNILGTLLDNSREDFEADEFEMYVLSYKVNGYITLLVT